MFPLLKHQGPQNIFALRKEFGTRATSRPQQHTSFFIATVDVVRALPITCQETFLKGFTVPKRPPTEIKQDIGINKARVRFKKQALWKSAQNMFKKRTPQIADVTLHALSARSVRS